MNPTTKHRPSGIGSTESIHYLSAFKHKARHEVLSWLCFLCLYKTRLLRPFCLRILFLLQYPSRDEGHSHILKMFLVTDGAAEVFLAALQLTNAWRIYTLPCCWHLWQSFFPILRSKWWAHDRLPSCICADLGSLTVVICEFRGSILLAAQCPASMRSWMVL